LRTLLKNGEESVVYKTYLNVIDQMSARLTRSKPFLQQGMMENKKLLEWGSRMLSIVSHDELKNTAILADIANHLDGRATQPPATRKVAEIAVKPAVIPEDAARPAEISEDVWDLMLEDVRQLHDREAFRHVLGEDKFQAVNLVWKDSEAERYVFADSRGNKALDLHAGQVSNYLYGKHLTRMDEKEISITERATYSFLQNLHNQLAFQANHDQLTGLLSRKAFEDELEQAYLESRSEGVSHVLAYMDLDRFNVINTTCGHAQGDVLLGQVAGVIRDTLKDDAIIARLGGDEFGMLLKQCSRTKGLMMVTQVHDNLRKLHFACDENEFKVTGSIGVSEINADSEGGGKLLSAVDSAAFTAKENGRDNIQIHNLENARISSRRSILDWVGRINVLFDKGLIQLRCQKIAPLHRTVNSLPHYEILLDVYDEERNKVPLDEFIVAAERYNRIIDIDNWVVDKVFSWLESHQNKLHRIDHVAINLSGVSIGNRHFMERIYEYMQKQTFPSNKVCFELTETIAVSNVENAARFMRKLKETGCQFSLDDFGKGTSSYSYLRSLPIDYVKIDGAFVKNIATNTGDYAVVKSINEIAHVMGKQTIAEYVEDEFIYEALRTIGLDFVQGYGVEKPIPLENLFG
jgi:diguanylate cyclase (GGDEF)-like protein